MAEPSAPRFAYRAFISYSHRDEAWARWLHNALETYRVPARLVGTTTAHGIIPRRLNPVFRDREELASADSLADKVNAALRQSENLIVICSPASATSRWVNEEVLAYKRMDRATRILCLIVDGEPNATDMPGRAAEECFCPALRFATSEDGLPMVWKAEPIAADARPGKDGKPNARLKLIAGMLDVGFDALKQREQHRRMRRMAAVTAAAICVMAVTIVLAIAALVSRQRAVIAQHKAVVAQQAAQRRQKQAEDLVDFMLGNLSDKLSAESRLDILKDVDNQAMAYFASMPPTDVNATALAQRAKALEKIGFVRNASGDLAGALVAYRASTAISARLAAAEPGNAARQVAYSRTLAFIGLTHWQQNRLTEAEHDFESARRLLQPLLTHMPNDVALLEQLSDLDTNLDHVLAAQGRSVSAMALVRDGLKLDQRLASIKPENGDYNDNLAADHNELGRLELQHGDLAGAIAEYRADVDIMTRLSRRNPNNRSWGEDLLEGLGMLGRTLALTGNATEAVQDLERAVDMAQALMKFDPEATRPREDFALYATELARLRRISGDTHGAAAMNAAAVAELTALTRKDPSNSNWQRAFAEALTEQAGESLTAGNSAAAQAAARHALQILTPQLTHNPDEHRILLAALAARLVLAAATDKAAAAQGLREKTLLDVRRVASDRADPRLLALQVLALLALHRNAEALAPIRQLWSEGYRDPEFIAALQHARIAYPTHPAAQQRLTASPGSNAHTQPPARPEARAPNHHE